MNVLDEIKQVCEALDKIDEYDESLSKELSNSDSALSDLYHKVEFSNFNFKTAYAMIKEQQKVLQERRKTKQDMTLLNTYKTNINKLIQRENRQLLLTEVNKRNKRLQNSEYKNNIYTEDELNKILEC